MFLESRCRGDRDLGLCTTSVLAFGEPQRNGKIRFFLCRNTFFFRKSPLRCGSPNACAQNLRLLYILILGTYSKFARKHNFLALDVCFPQLCSSAGRRSAVSRSRVQNYRRIVLFPQQKKSMKCVVDWIPLTIRVRCKILYFISSSFRDVVSGILTCRGVCEMFFSSTDALTSQRSPETHPPLPLRTKLLVVDRGFIQIHPLIQCFQGLNYVVPPARFKPL